MEKSIGTLPIYQVALYYSCQAKVYYCTDKSKLVQSKIMLIDNDLLYNHQEYIAYRPILEPIFNREAKYTPDEILQLIVDRKDVFNWISQGLAININEVN